jgi:3'-phosphoadenosine 5'-phosphosulfate sulfotransferase (PAPS reductase)/FAD synthetase
MADPFKIDGPTCISFSGGRTSAYMLWRVLQAHGMSLPDEAQVLFANTGKEDEATLRFVQACSEHWKVPITWLEWQDAEEQRDRLRIVDFKTASRNGQPFEALIRKKNYLPNPVTRFCTVDLKIKPFANYCRHHLGWDEWDNMIGIRSDEPRRVAKIRANPSDGMKGIHRLMPLADVGVTKRDVAVFWANQPFDLELPNLNGITYHGNCDLCFLKGASQIYSLIAEKPERAIWWAKQEGSITNPGIVNGGYFRKDRPSYAAMAKYAEQQADMFDKTEEAIACFCGE